LDICIAIVTFSNKFVASMALTVKKMKEEGRKLLE
jgi:hypothetical protein